MIEEKENFQVELNVTAPTFHLKDIYNRMINLESYKGKRVFIGFFRHAGCPFCNIRIHALARIHQELKENNMEMIYFFESTENILLQSTFHKGISPIPLIADPEKIYYNMYGIENAIFKSSVSHLSSFIQTAIKAKIKGLPMHMMAEGESFSTMPAEFLLDEDLIIRKIHYSRRLNDRLSLQVIKDFSLAKKQDLIR